MPKSTLTRDQVLQAERPAWAHGRRYFYDGISFWKRTILSQQVSALQTPVTGWRHRSGCHCEFCSGERETPDLEGEGQLGGHGPSDSGQKDDLSLGGRAL